MVVNPPAAPSAAVLPSRSLGRSGLTVSMLGFVCAPVGDLYTRINEYQARATIAAALAAGINLFDVAPLYGHGLAEHRLGAVLREQPRERFILSARCWCLRLSLRRRSGRACASTER
jgi:D-threo-aldose 1-dehydrogenase